MIIDLSHVSGIIPSPETPADEIHNIQTIIDHLALDYLNIDLSHISGGQVMAGNARAIYNLLEIFCGLHKYLSSHELGTASSALGWLGSGAAGLFRYIGLL